jgi:hypothetical protein
MPHRNLSGAALVASRQAEVLGSAQPSAPRPCFARAFWQVALASAGLRISYGLGARSYGLPTGIPTKARKHRRNDRRQSPMFSGAFARVCWPSPNTNQSGRPDSNRGPRRPERRALPGCATPRRTTQYLTSRSTPGGASQQSPRRLQPDRPSAPRRTQSCPRCSTTSSEWPSGSRNQNIGGTGSPMRETCSSTSTPRERSSA